MDYTYFVQEKAQECELLKKRKLQDAKRQATAENKNIHWSCLSQMEIREMFAD